MANIRSNRELGELIRACREAGGLRQVDLAKKASLRQALISELENGETNVRLSTLMKVLAALEMDLAVVPREQAIIDPKEY